MTRRNDTICAISTPSGVGGVAVVRISGPQALPMAQKMLKKDLPDHKAVFGRIFHNGEMLDEVMATFYAAPHSYTGEDVVEISCHGSLYVQQELLSLCIQDGARLAEPGEYTMRAFLNGKMDLAQSEAVADLIDATSLSQHRLAVNQLRGGFSRKLSQIRERFIELTSLLELELDFSDEDVEFADRSQLFSLVKELKLEAKKLVDSFQMGNAIKRGIPVAIVGKPNVGKSTLLNALLNDDRAIVSDIPGTTRDTIEDTLVIEGVTFRFIDTAGIRHSNDVIENAGIERSMRSVEKAQIVLLLSDDENPYTIENLSQEVDLSGKKIWNIHNKCDLSHQGSESNSNSDFYISAKTGEGLDSLKEALVKSVAIQSDETLLSNARHHEAMMHILEALNHVEEGLNSSLPGDLLVIDIRDALYHLGEITGQVSNDEILGTIFSRFCIGK